MDDGYEFFYVMLIACALLIDQGFWVAAGVVAAMMALLPAVHALLRRRRATQAPA